MKKVAIPEKMQKFYGTGIMLHPDKEMVEGMMQEIPYGKVATIDTFCQKLAQDYNTNVICPMRISNFVKAIAETYSDSSTLILFWRVIRNDHLLINSPFTKTCVDNLKKEGFQIHQNSKGQFEVLDIENRLFTFSHIDYHITASQNP